MPGSAMISRRGFSVPLRTSAVSVVSWSRSQSFCGFVQCSTSNVRTSPIADLPRGSGPGGLRVEGVDARLRPIDLDHSFAVAPFDPAPAVLQHLASDRFGVAPTGNVVEKEPLLSADQGFGVGRLRFACFPVDPRVAVALTVSLVSQPVGDDPYRVAGPDDRRSVTRDRCRKADIESRVVDLPPSQLEPWVLRRLRHRRRVVDVLRRDECPAGENLEADRALVMRCGRERADGLTERSRPELVLRERTEDAPTATGHACPFVTSPLEIERLEGVELAVAVPVHHVVRVALGSADVMGDHIAPDDHAAVGDADRLLGCRRRDRIPLSLGDSSRRFRGAFIAGFVLTGLPWVLYEVQGTLTNTPGESGSSNQ